MTDPEAVKEEAAPVPAEGAAPADPPAETPDAEAPREMTLMGHLEELRTRVLRAGIAVIVGFAACYAFAEQLFGWLMEPLRRVLPDTSYLIFTGLPEAFMTYMKVAFVAGLFLASPYVFYQIWLFVAPGLYSHERRWIMPIALVSALFFVSGAMFGYYIVFPVGFEFFLSYGNEFIRPMPTLKEYLSFSLHMLFAFGVIFELPLFIFFLARLGVVTSEGLRKHRRWAVLVAFIVAAILTPTPDAANQFLMAGPIIVFYELGIWAAHFFGKKKPAGEAGGEGAVAEAAQTGEDAGA